ncbi:MAG: carboxypeptidase-like regulatory domain-containing protein [Bacteroides sp.]|nr:carboxypeptidase-like regulatory domain-containing protein [Bacteroidales bacterium]MCM1068807.1 carboxypeptidase-like regulatory domain-containing protein [Prevotella sp.]MCM1353948.1 carboxypeptidase-like regulatory domain-containing protein [Bacteroides sp.]MCM1403212.1 carboxypeptidase-like regulatory domain-containing protein [Bacteroides sp.]MCM1443346.1 carboxypeptidase-like regulatory domain-containing protein [Muribaculum sp.]
MRRFFITMLACVSAVVMFAQQTSLKGRILSEDNDSPVIGATVKLANQNISTTTNLNGEFALIYLEAIDEEVVIAAKGYVTTVKLIQLHPSQTNDMGNITLKADIQKELKDEIILQLAENELNDDEGRSQSMASNTSASTDVFNSNTSYAWSTVRYRQRGYEQTYEQTYINGLSFNGQERGTFSYSMLGGLNDASRNKDVINGMEANAFTFGDFGQSTNILMHASNFAQGWKVGLAGTNRNYKGRINATYASGILPSGWAFVGQLAWRYSPYIDTKGIIGEGISYNSLGYFFSAEKQWNGGDHRLSLTTFGSPTKRGQSAAVTQEVYDLTGSINYNPYWGYQNGKVRNSRIVKSFDPTAIVDYEWKIDDDQTLKVALGYHYSMYSNSALTFYNAPDPRPDYYRNLPSFLWDGQIDRNGNFISNSFDGSQGSGNWTGTSLGSFNDQYGIGPSINESTYRTLTDLWTSRDNATTQINWDNLYAANHQNNIVNPTGSAKYMLERRHNDLQEAIFNANYQNKAYDHLTITAGLEAKYSQGIHYKTVDDLLAANQWIDIDPFADRDMKDLASNVGLTQTEIEAVKQNDIYNPNKSVTTGNRFGYDYRINMTNVALWAQNEWNFNAIDFYYALKVTYSGINRSTNMMNGRAWYLAQHNQDEAYYYLGKQYQEIIDGRGQDITTFSGWQHNFVDPSFKIGFTYKIDGRNKLKINAMAETSAPLARDAYISPRVHDRAIETIYTHDRAQSIAQQNKDYINQIRTEGISNGLSEAEINAQIQPYEKNANALYNYYAASQKTVSYDLTYEFNYPIVRGRVTAYQTHFWNGSELNGYYDDEARTFVNQSLTGINRIHRGLEVAAAFKLGTYFTLTPMLAIGDYRYTSNAYSVTSAENGMGLAEDAVKGNLYELKDSVLIKGLKVANGPQLNASLKLSFFHPKMWFADITVSYFDWNYLDYAPSRRMQGLYTGVRADGTAVNGSYANPVPNNNSITALQYDEEGNLLTNKYGIPELAYPYNKLADQESLVDCKWYNRFLIDVSVGKLIYLKNRQSLSINLSVSNITNNTHMKTGGYQQARLPRQSVQGTSNPERSAITTNVWKFPSKYYYAWGANFFLNLTYKF